MIPPPSPLVRSRTYDDFTNVIYQDLDNIEETQEIDLSEALQINPNDIKTDHIDKRIKTICKCAIL